MTPAVDHLAQLRAMLTFERSLVDRVGPPGCAARETAAANVAALEWAVSQLDPDDIAHLSDLTLEEQEIARRCFSMCGGSVHPVVGPYMVQRRKIDERWTLVSVMSGGDYVYVVSWHVDGKAGTPERFQLEAGRGFASSPVIQTPVPRD